MDTRRVTVILTVAAIALVFVGIGFAYTAFTANENNTTDVSYVTLTQADNDPQTPYSGAYRFANNAAVKLDTYNETNAQTSFYALNNPEVLDLGGTEYKLIELGIFDLVANYEGEAGTKPAKLDIGVVSSSGFNPNDGWAYFLSDSTHTKIYSYKCTTLGNDWIDGPDALVVAFGESTEVNTTVTVLFGHNTNIETVTKAGLKFFEASKKPVELTDGDLIFKAESIAADDEGSSTPLLTVTYDKNEGTGTDIDPVKVLNGSSIVLLGEDTFTPPASKVFSKWQIGTTEYDAGQTVTGITVDTTIKAIWVDQPEP